MDLPKIVKRSPTKRKGGKAKAEKEERESKKAEQQPKEPEAEGPVCPVCGTRAGPKAERCSECGVEFEPIEPPEDKVIEPIPPPSPEPPAHEAGLADCPICGASVTLAMTSCPNCGAEFEIEEPSEQPPKVPEMAAPGPEEPAEEGDQAECPICGSMASVSAKMCPFCGAEFEPVQQGPEPPPPAPVVEEESVACPVCGRAVGMTVSACLHCGAEFEPMEVPSEVQAIPSEPAEMPGEEEVQCPVCGNSVGLQVTACPHCGVEFETEEETEAATLHWAAPPKAEEPAKGIIRPRASRVSDTRRGISNGASAINGVSLVNGMGGATGPSRINGTGATNGVDLINGMGLSNGRVNGRRQGPRGRRASVLMRWQLLAVIIAVAIIAPLALFLTITTDKSPYSVDGDYGDWEDEARLTSLAEAESPSINVVEWSVATYGQMIYLYLQTEMPTMAGDTVEGFVLFIDADDPPDTGYDLSEIGAEVMIKIQGWNGTVSVSLCSVYDNSQDRLDWSSWRPSGGVTASVDGARLEASANLPRAVNGTSKVILISVNEDGAGCQSCALPLEGPVLMVEQLPSPDISDHGVLDFGPDVLVSTLKFTCLRDAGTVESVIPSLGGMALLAPVGTFSLEPGDEMTVELRTDASSLTPTSLVFVEVTSDGIESSFAYVHVMGHGMRAYAYAPPTSISIDGAFADWTGKTVADVDDEQLGNPNIDIDEIGGANDTEDSYFFVSVQGELFAGAYFPESCSKPATGGGGAVVPARRTGEDRIRIYVDIDSNPTTGFRISVGQAAVGAERLIEVSGLMGEIQATSVNEYSGGNWTELTSAMDVSAFDAMIEIGVDSETLGAIGEVDFLVITTDWRKSQDMAWFVESLTGPGRSFNPPSVDAYSEGPSIESMPEFEEIAMPLVFTIAIFFVLTRRRRHSQVPGR